MSKQVETLTTQPPLQITESAVKELLQLQAEEEAGKELPLRVGVKSGGCSGYSYTLDFGQAAEGELQFDIAGLSVSVDPEHLSLLRGTIIDFENGLNNRGFVFLNPNADETCGCGQSFG